MKNIKEIMKREGEMALKENEIKEMKQKAGIRTPKEPEQKPETKTESSVKDHWAKRFYLVTSKLRASIKANEKGYDYNYCNLQNLMKIAYPDLAKRGLIVIQTIQQNIHGKNFVKTDLLDMFANGKTVLSSEMVFPDIVLGKKEFDGDFEETSKYSKKNGKLKKTTYENYNQALGATETYMRRYTLFCLLGILPEPDKDGFSN